MTVLKELFGDTYEKIFFEFVYYMFGVDGYGF